MISFLFSCEHATCAVPEAHRELFRGSEDTVASAEGWEPGSLNLAQGFSMKFRTPLVHGDVTRLLIDLDESGDGRWSRFSLKLTDAGRQKLQDRHEKAYRTTLRQRISEDLQRHAAVIHIMIHTAEMESPAVMFETGPGDELGEKFAARWRDRMALTFAGCKLSRGVPRSGLAADLRSGCPAARYATIRLTVAQSFFLDGTPLRWEVLKKALLLSLAQAESGFEAANAPESISSDRH